MKARKKPVEVEIFDMVCANPMDVLDFCEGNAYLDLRTDTFYTKTLEGHMQVSDTDIVIKGVNGEFYPCKRDIFYKTYEVTEL